MLLGRGQAERDPPASGFLRCPTNAHKPGKLRRVPREGSGLLSGVTLSLAPRVLRYHL